MDRIPINWGLIREPANWAHVILMIWIGGLALSLIFHRQLIAPLDGGDN